MSAAAEPPRREEEQFVVPASGMYQVTGRAEFCPQQTHYTSINVLLNGNSIAYDDSAIAGGCRTNKATETAYLNAGDVLTMTLYDSVNGPSYGIQGVELTILRLR